MNKIDIAFFIVLGIAVLRGFFKGFTYEMLSLFSTIAGVIGALFLYGMSSPMLTKIGMSDEVANYTSGILIFLAIVFVIQMISRVLIDKSNIKVLGLFDNLIGVVFSCIKYSIIICVLMLIIKNMNDNYHFFGEESVQGSFMYSSYMNIANTIYNTLKSSILS